MELAEVELEVALIVAAVDELSLVEGPTATVVAEADTLVVTDAFVVATVAFVVTAVTEVAVVAWVAPDVTLAPFPVPPCPLLAVMISRPQPETASDAHKKTLTPSLVKAIGPAYWSAMPYPISARKARVSATTRS